MRFQRFFYVILAEVLSISYVLTLGKNQTYTLTQNEVEEGFCDTTKQITGYFKIQGSKSKNYFFWFFESRSDPKNDPVIIWLTGGPGCSSMLALLAENGPCSVQDDLTLKRNPNGWNSNANIMWIDQPAGVGFSYGDGDEHDTTEAEVGDDLYHFMLEFFQAHPEYVKLPFFVFGESYGGHYVPAVSNRIYKGNLASEGPLKINLQGFGIGNGLTDPQVQYKYYPEMAYHNTYNITAVSHGTYTAMKAASPVCTAMISACQSMSSACLAAEAFCNTAMMVPYVLSGLNVYDIREKCKHKPLCYDFSNVEKFLRLEDTLKKLHIDPHSSKWEACNFVVHNDFAYDWMKNFHELVVPLLENGIRGIIYAGDADYIVNWMGCKAWTMILKWKYQKDFMKASDEDWTIDGKVAGKVRTADTLTFLQVFNAGHMVPMNQPENSLKMLNAFTKNQAW